MADHQDLVAEMVNLEQMGTQERQKLARKRRSQQLKKWAQREKEYLAKEKQMNKRLAMAMNEENNGMNLKYYTQYATNERSPKKKLTQSAAIGDHDKIITNGLKNNNNNVNDKAIYNNNNNNNNHISAKDLKWSKLHNNINANLRGVTSKVQFDQGVMLLEAAARNDFEEVRRLLSFGVSPNSVNHDGLTALHQCCIEANEPMMNLLLTFGADVNALDTESWTPMHAACTCGHSNLVRILVEHGADLLALNGDGNMPFDLCEDEQTLDYLESVMIQKGITQELIDEARASIELRFIEDIKELIESDRDVNEPINESGVTRLHVAAANNYATAVKLLLDHNANVNVCDKDLWQPLHGAVCWGTENHMKTIESLVNAGASMDAKTIGDETVFDLCDNVQILNGLSQLKDELENKAKQQAAITESDKLRRTQSRTNSRIHSIRRTSVRDKNQISRREAREEALLRVDSNSLPRPPVGGSDTTATKLQATTTIISMNTSGAEAPVAPATETLNDTTTTMINDYSDHNSSVYSTLNGSHQQTKHHQMTASDQTSKVAINTNQIKPLKTTRVSESLSSEPQSDTSGTSSLDSTATTTTMTIHPNTKRNTGVCNHNNLHHSYDHDSNNINHLNHDTRRAQVKPSNKQQANSHQTHNIQNHDNHDKMISSSRLAKGVDAKPGTTTSVGTGGYQETSIVMIGGPTTYTLSNLKKQRSDMRMRSISSTTISVDKPSVSKEIVISGHEVLKSTSPSSSPQVESEPDLANDQQQISQAELFPKVVLNKHRKEPAGSNFTANDNDNDNIVGATVHKLNGGLSQQEGVIKRFSGESSEPIGGYQVRKPRRRCCSLM